MAFNFEQADQNDAKTFARELGQPFVTTFDDATTVDVIIEGSPFAVNAAFEANGRIVCVTNRGTTIVYNLTELVELVHQVEQATRLDQLKHELIQKGLPKGEFRECLNVWSFRNNLVVGASYGELFTIHSTGGPPIKTLVTKQQIFDRFAQSN